VRVYARTVETPVRESVQLRTEHAEVERLADRDVADADAYLRKDYTARYGSLGGRYEDYKPAYWYGHSLATDPHYAGRSWDDFETDARADWERRYPGNTWARMKAAVRHGWERVKH
jgi:hypothetical protein